MKNIIVKNFQSLFLLNTLFVIAFFAQTKAVAQNTKPTGDAKDVRVLCNVEQEPNMLKLI